MGWHFDAIIVALLFAIELQSAAVLVGDAHSCVNRRSNFAGRMT
jgi:hypothetical protein